MPILPLLLALVLPPSVAVAPGADTLRLFTGSPTGAYRAFGEAVARTTGDASTGLSIRTVPSSGSVENIRAVASGDADMAIVQSDMAYFADRGQGPFDGTPLRNVRVLAGLHYETVLVIARKGSGIENVSQIRAGHRVVIGQAGSGTIQNASDILTNLGSSFASLDTIMRSPRTSLHLLRTDSADAVFLTGGVGPEFFEQVDDEGGTVVSLSPSLINTLTTRYPYFGATSFVVDGRQISTLRIRSLLVAREDVPDSSVFRVTQGIVDGMPTIRSAHPGGVDILPSTLRDAVPVLFHEAALRALCESEVGGCTSGFPFLIVISLGIAGMLISLKFSETSRRLMQRFTPAIGERLVGPSGLTRQYRYVLIPAIIASALISGAYGVQRSEAEYARAHNVQSDFEDIGLTENLLWLFVFTATGYENDRFPNSITGSLISAVMGAVGVGGFLLLFGLITSDHIVHRIRMGSRIDPQVLQGHVIVAGWSSRAPGIIRSLIDPALGPRGQSVVVLADRAEDPLLQHDFSEDRVIFIRGLPSNVRNLLRAGIDRADTLIVLADASVAPEDRDGRSLMVLIQAEKRTNAPEAGGDRVNRLHTVVEIVDPTSRSAMEIAYADEIVCGRELDECVVVQSVLNPGVSSFLREVLTVDDRNEIIEVPVTEKTGKGFSGLTFREALTRGLEAGALLIGVNKSGAPGAVRKARGRPSLMVNPVGSEAEYAIQVGDSLLFLADSERTLQKDFGDPSRWQGSFRGRR